MAAAVAPVKTEQAETGVAVEAGLHPNNVTPTKKKVIGTSSFG